MASDSARWRLPGPWYLYAGASVPLGWYLLGGRSTKRQDAGETQFDHFLRQPVAPQAPADDRISTQFDSFLRVRPVASEPDPCVFSTWIKTSGSAAAPQAAAPPSKPAEQVPLDRAAVAVLYGTEYGFSKEIAEKLCDGIKATSGFWCGARRVAAWRAMPARRGGSTPHPTRRPAWPLACAGMCCSLVPRHCAACAWAGGGHTPGAALGTQSTLPSVRPPPQTSQALPARHGRARPGLRAGQGAGGGPHLLDSGARAGAGVLVPAPGSLAPVRLCARTLPCRRCSPRPPPPPNPTPRHRAPQGDGVPPTEARDFCEWLFAGKAGQLGGLNYAVLALGDKTYTHFCRCGKQLDAAMQAAGAQQVRRQQQPLRWQ